jgi:micrococcal nuclease
MFRLWQLLLPLALAILAACSTAVEVPQATSTGEAPTTVASVNFPSATVVSVGDGDTMRINYQGQTITVRLACIDAPETAQTPWGPAATDRLRQLTPRDSTIQFRQADTDRYGRTVAEIYAGGQNVNLQMVQEGYAVVYTQFLRSCPETSSTLQAAEAQAQQQQLNFWSQSNPVMPWDFRRSNRSS